MRPTTQKQASKRAEVAVRRHKALELKIAGHSDRAIAHILDVDVSTAHRDVKNVLEAMAREHAEEAANLRALLNIRYEELFNAYYDQAIAGDGLIVVGVEQCLVPDVEECPQVGGLLRMLPRHRLQDVLDVVMSGGYPYPKPPGDLSVGIPSDLQLVSRAE